WPAGGFAFPGKRNPDLRVQSSIDQIKQRSDVGLIAGHGELTYNYVSHRTQALASRALASDCYKFTPQQYQR
ncbi:hypothetical protein, partial [Pseudomonas savastanoi]|uniref:hypothetical protein n=4 Tax=Pseudomonas savastanoi TaxID=29438 RepID=UPI001C7E2DE9